MTEQLFHIRPHGSPLKKRTEYQVNLLEDLQKACFNGTKTLEQAADTLAALIKPEFSLQTRFVLLTQVTKERVSSI